MTQTNNSGRRETTVAGAVLIGLVAYSATALALLAAAVDAAPFA